MIQLLTESLGESKDFWAMNWQGHSPQSEIMMWDFPRGNLHKIQTIKKLIIWS
jgi:hypothetical protein